MQKSNILAPPGLIAPLNQSPVISETPRTASIHFEWKPVDGAIGYTLRVSPTNMFTRLVKEVKASGTSTEVTGLDAAEYFSNVSPSDAKKETSEFTETIKVSLVTHCTTQQ